MSHMRSFHVHSGRGMVCTCRARVAQPKQTSGVTGYQPGCLAGRCASLRDLRSPLLLTCEGVLVTAT